MNWRLFISAATLVFPWPVRRVLLNRLLGYKIAADTHIGLSLIACEQFVMERGSWIGHFSFLRADLVYISEQCQIGNLNWITGVPRRASSHFRDEPARRSELRLGRHAAITARHLIDCSNVVTIGDFSTIAGAGTQILTHGIDLHENRQRSAPVSIGRYCFVATRCVLTKGAAIPDYAVLAANSCVYKELTDSFCLYSGVPAVKVAELPREAAYFRRRTGFVL